MYGDDGKGVAIGINLDVLVERVKREYKIKNLIYKDVIYDTNEKKKSIQELMPLYEKLKETTNLIVELDDSITEEAERKKELFTKQLKLISQIDNKLHSCEILFKNSAFKSEEEVRIVYMPDSTFGILGGLSQKFYVNSKTQIVSFCELSFLELSSEIISEIILGPKCPIIEDDQDFKLFLKANGLEDTRIKKSAIPYI